MSVQESVGEAPGRLRPPLELAPPLPGPAALGEEVTGVGFLGFTPPPVSLYL